MAGLTAKVPAGPQAFGEVEIRYVGRLAEKQDTLLGTKRVWPGPGSVLRVPQKEARSYLLHPMVWALASEPWVPPPPERLSSEAVVDLLRRGELAALEQTEPELAALLAQGDADIRRVVAPLHEEDAGRLLAHVPGLAAALVQGVSESVFVKLDFVRDLLQAYPPLLDACVETEREGKNRREVVKRLESLQADMLSLDGVADPAQDESAPTAGPAEGPDEDGA